MLKAELPTNAGLSFATVARLARGLSIRSVQTQLKKILSSRAFARSEQLKGLLRFTVEQTISGEAGQIREYLVGLAVFGRSDSYDPATDSIVRVQAHRLRLRLKAYYETEGRQDRVFIEIPKGAYVPTFRRRRPVPSGSGAAPRRLRLLDGGRTLAVLPLVSLSDEKEVGYLTDRLSEEIVDACSTVGALRVASCASTLQLKGKIYDVRDIGKRLNSSAVLEGISRKEGDGLRVRVRLIRVLDGCQLWSESYERNMNDFLTLPRELSRVIADAVSSQMAKG